MTLQTSKRPTAIIVACSALALGALGVARAEQRDFGAVMSEPTTSTALTSPTMTTGETRTDSPAPTSLETPIATPQITTTPTSAEPD